MECFMSFTLFSIHFTNYINRWYLQGTVIDLHLFLCTSQPLLEFSYCFLLLIPHLTPCFKQSFSFAWDHPTSSLFPVLFNFISSARFCGQFWNSWHGQTSSPKPNLQVSLQLQHNCSFPFTSSSLEQEYFFLSFIWWKIVFQKLQQHNPLLGISALFFFEIFLCVGSSRGGIA